MELASTKDGLMYDARALKIDVENCPSQTSSKCENMPVMKIMLIMKIISYSLFLYVDLVLVFFPTSWIFLTLLLKFMLLVMLENR